MKKLIHLALLFTISMLASCDYVSNPYPPKNANLGDSASCPTPTFPTLTTHVKKILIEDYTGHICGNCPAAAIKLHEIDTTYPGQIIGVAVHPIGGGLADPTPGYNGSPSTAFTADFRTTAGNEYDGVFGAGSFGLPEGMFNRKDFNATTQTHLKQLSNWSSYVAGIIGETSVVDLQLITDYDASTQKLCTSVRSSFLTNVSGTYNLVLLLTQDSIIDWQYENTAGNIPNYVFNHMLRDALTPSGAWGETIVTGSAVTGATNTMRFAYTIPAQYNNIPCDVNQCHVVAFIYNTATYEIIQSEEADVIP